MRFIKILLSIVLLGVASYTFAAVTGSVGFVQGNIWYSKDPFFAGNDVRIYSGVFNSGSDDIVGTVEFYDNGVSLGSSEFQAIGGGRLREVWIDWRATAGTHTITAKIIKAFVTRAGKTDTASNISNSDSGQSIREVDTDTDADGVGNTVDTDDDNDGVSDVDEVAKGRDPLNKDIEQGSSLEAVPFTESQPALDTAKKVVASVTETVDSTADQLKAPLLAKKAELEKRIGDLKVLEAGVEQTREGKAINDATGGNTVTPTRTTSTPGDTMARIGLQLYRGVIIAVLFVLDHKIILYLLLAFILYKLVRFVFRRFSRRSI